MTKAPPNDWIPFPGSDFRNWGPWIYHGEEKDAPPHVHVDLTRKGTPDTVVYLTERGHGWGVNYSPVWEEIVWYRLRCNHPYYRTATDHALALVAAAYEDAADSIQKFGVTPLVDAGHDSASFFVATYGRDVARTRTPDDAIAALERVKQEVAEQAAKLADEWYHNSGHGSPGDEIRAALIRKG